MLTCEISRLVCSVPQFPEEDSKLRATALQVRRGGNCPNTIEVLQQLVLARGQQEQLKLHLVSVLPDPHSSATRKIRASFAVPPAAPQPAPSHVFESRAESVTDAASATATVVDLSCCIYTGGHHETASSYIIRSAATGSRTIVNYNNLPEMTKHEFEFIVNKLIAQEHPHSDDKREFLGENWLWHFEVGSDIPVVHLLTEQSLRALRLLIASLPYSKCYGSLDETVALVSSTRVFTQSIFILT